MIGRNSRVYTSLFFFDGLQHRTRSLFSSSSPKPNLFLHFWQRPPVPDAAGVGGGSPKSGAALLTDCQKEAGGGWVADGPGCAEGGTFVALG